jgi:formylglycine-generating enzyme required for sulfatase activity
MVWVDGDDFAANSKDEFTDPEADQVFETPGFWIDKSVVSKSSYQAFVAATGYVGGAPVVHGAASVATPATHESPQVFGLRDLTATETAPHALHYISHADAMAFCKWKGMELSSQEQFEFAQASSDVLPTAGTLIPASHPWASESGFRCVKLPEWAHQQGYAVE